MTATFTSSAQIDDTMSDVSTPSSYTQTEASAPYEEEYSIPADAINSAPLLSSPAEKTRSNTTLRAMGGAAVVGGVAGLLLVGPIVGLAAAGGAAALATTKGKAGDVTRATGETVASAGSRLKKMDEKHHITDKAAKGVIKSANWVSNKIKPKS
ncbi:hypothetical protein ACA910_016616 [Epithemia clementina (nom. ined.)]